MRWPERFWEKVDKSNDCWLWTARRNRSGYGEVGVPGDRTRLAHRVAWSLLRGEIPPGLAVLHACDTPACVNPDHLRLGTHSDNMADMVARGRQLRGASRSVVALRAARRGAAHWSAARPDRVPVGEQASMAKLTSHEVSAIRAAGDQSSDTLAARYGVSRTAINHIRARRTWKHVP